MTGSKSKESAGERKYISDNMEKEGCRRTVLVGALCAIVFPFLYANKSVLSDGCIVGNPLIYLIITEALIVTAIATSYLALLSKDTGILSRKVCLVALACSVFADALLFRNIYFQQMVFIILSAAVSWAMLWSVKMTLIWMITLAAVACANLSISGWSIELVICMFAAVGFSSVISELSYMSVREKMKNHYYLKKAQNDADTDPMTKLYNRRGLNRRIESIWQMCRRHKINMTIIMLDIDDFKCYNDTFGHPAGDRCISTVSSQIRKNARRKSDIVSRVGGEEFLLVFTGLTRQQAIERGEAIRKSIYQLKMEHSPDSLHPYVTVSIGVAHTNFKEDITFEQLYGRADECLYKAKQQGKNCVYADEAKVIGA